MKEKETFNPDTFHLATLISDQAERFGDRAAFAHRDEGTGKWISVSWNEAEQHCRALAKGLIASGHKPSDRVAIFSQNMYEAIVADFANISALGTTVPMYATSTKAQIRYMIDDAAIGIIFAGEQYQYDTVLDALEESDTLQLIVAIDRSIDLRGCKTAIRYNDLIALGESADKDAELDRRIASASHSNLTSILYTSGTTGQSKGVCLHEYNYVNAIRIHQERLGITSDRDIVMMFLPVTHVFERAWSYFVMQRGATIYINRIPTDIQKAMREVHPNMMCTVPRYFEKLYAEVNRKIDSSTAPVRMLFRYAIGIGRRRNLEYKRIGEKVPTLLRIKYRFIAQPLFRRVWKAAGIDQGKFFPCAGARLSDEINEFMHAIGINVVMGYGLTESTATVSCYYPENRFYQIKSCGRIMPDVQVRISDNGEIQLKGDTITSGYYNRPDADKEAFTDDGWFRTGDCGYIDHNRNLYITDRIKDLFKTAGGKYIAPQHIEGIVGNDRYIEQVAAIGNERKYVSVLIVPDYKAVEEYARAQGATFTTRAELLALKEVQELFGHIIKQKNVHFARYEQVKRFTLLPHPFSVEKGQLTNTLKLRRKVIDEMFAEEIDRMYK